MWRFYNQNAQKPFHILFVGVGSKLADKIWEIAQSGELRKLNEFQSSEQVQVLKIFTNVWGAGPTTANAWYQQVKA